MLSACATQPPPIALYRLTTDAYTVPYVREQAAWALKALQPLPVRLAPYISYEVSGRAMSYGNGTIFRSRSLIPQQLRCHTRRPLHCRPELSRSIFPGKNLRNVPAFSGKNNPNLQTVFSLVGRPGLSNTAIHSLSALLGDRLRR